MAIDAPFAEARQRTLAGGPMLLRNRQTSSDHSHSDLKSLWPTSSRI
jgi:hypothetical protein